MLGGNVIDRRRMMAGAAALGAVAVAQPAWSASGWAGDIAILRKAYSAIHPGLYRYAMPGEVAARFDALEAAFAQGPDLRSAYLTLSRFLATIKCGHTYANFYNQSDAVAAALFGGRNKVPFEFRWLGARMVVTENRSREARLSAGTEVLAIDGRPVSAILSELMAFARADGGNDAKRRALLEVRGVDAYETFDVFYGLLYPGNGTFRLTVRVPGQSGESALEVPALNLAERRSTQRKPAAKDAAKWTLAFPAERTALLTMPDWVMYNTKWDWRAFLDATFAEMKDRRATGLIVDLRDNEGGNDCGDEIIARLIDRDLPLEAYERRVRYRRTPADIDAYLDTWDPSFKTLGEKADDIGGGFFRLPVNSETGNIIRPKGPRFTGKVVVLTGPQNSSATFQFASTIKANRLARLVGEATGGNQRGINGGAYFFLRLPASGLEAELPLIGYFPRGPKPDAGIDPDFAVAPAIEDFAARRDPALAAAMRLAG
jgi:hypothetical protein